MNYFIHIPVFLCAIFILILIHELGHFLVARIFNVKVKRFSIGFGKPFYTYTTKNSIEYSIAPILLGGYVKLFDTRYENKSSLSSDSIYLAYDKKPLLQRLAIIIAGPVANIIFALLAFWLMFVIGFKSPKPIIDKIVPASIAARASMHSGEEIVKIDKQNITTWDDVSLALISHVGDLGNLSITTKNLVNLRENIYTLDLLSWKFDSYEPNLLFSLGIIGYKPSLNKDKNVLSKWPEQMLRQYKYGGGKAFNEALYKSWLFTNLNRVILAKIITGKLSSHVLGGPISIFFISGYAAKHGFVTFLNFLAIISLSLALLNLFPLPGLDGGYMVLIILEAIIKRPISMRVQNLLMRLGIAFFVVLIIQITLNDLIRIFR